MFLHLDALVVMVGLLGAGTAAAPGPISRVTVAATEGADLDQWSRRIDDMTQRGELRVARTDEDPQIAGRRHERLEQLYRGVPVWGGELVRQQAAGRPVSIFGTLYEGIALDVKPALSGQDALQRARAAANATAGVADPPRLVIYPVEHREYVLAYRVRLRHDGQATVFFIDARSGRVVDRYSDLKTTGRRRRSS